MTVTEPQAAARIIDQGYRRYTGERGDRFTSMRSVMRFTSQRVLGLHRKARYKVLPAAVIILSYVPAVVFVGMIVISKRFGEVAESDRFIRGVIANFAEYYNFIISAIVLFAAFVGPEVLCPDRTNGMLGLYLAGPLNRLTYVVSKFAAVVMMMCTVTLGPPLLLLIGYSTQGYGPSGFSNWMLTLGRILLSGLLMSVLYTAVILAVSALTTRRAAASATLLVLMVGAPLVIAGLIVGARQSERLWLLSLLNMPRFLIQSIHNMPTRSRRVGRPRLPATELLMSYGAWLALALLVLTLAYRRMRVTR